jgi:tRNA wybutosine-synthesizing protein 1
MQIRHCALSLVGEPIMYPHINELIDLLHSKKISSFLVTNAQFPNEIKSLEPVTQLYVSVDAATKESLKKIDRPLFRDFWERFLACLRALKDKVRRLNFLILFITFWVIGTTNSISINVSKRL